MLLLVVVVAAALGLDEDYPKHAHRFRNTDADKDKILYTRAHKLIVWESAVARGHTSEMVPRHLPFSTDPPAPPLLP